VIPLSQVEHYVNVHSCDIPTFPRSMESQVKGPQMAETEVEAIAEICIGKCDFDLLCVSIRSLRLSGGWRGPIYVFTDDPVTMQDRCIADFTPIQVEGDMSYQEIQQIKRNMFEMLPNKPKTVMYVDTDIVAVQCLSNMEALFSDFLLRVFPDNICLDCNVYNGGTILMHDTPDTRQCLKDWTDELKVDNYQKYEKEQPALDYILTQGKCEIIDPLPREQHIFMSVDILSPGIVPRIQLLFSNPIFAHFTHGIRGTSKWPRILHDIISQLDHLEKGSAKLAVQPGAKLLRTSAYDA